MDTLQSSGAWKHLRVEKQPQCNDGEAAAVTSPDTMIEKYEGQVRIFRCPGGEEACPKNRPLLVHALMAIRGSAVPYVPPAMRGPRATDVSSALRTIVGTAQPGESRSASLASEPITD